MIDEQRTFELFGYYSNDLKPKSVKSIVVVCDECGKYRILAKYNYRILCISCSQKGKHLSEEHKRKLSEAQSGKHLSEEHKRKISEKESGKHLSEEHKRKISDSLKGKPNGKKGKHHSEETRIKISCIRRGIPVDDFNGFARDKRYCNLWTESFREMIRERFHNKCYICDATKEDNNNRKLSVHHVNYDKNCLCGSNCEFVPLCIRCHSKTNRNRQYWENLIMCYLYPERCFMVDM